MLKPITAPSAEPITLAEAKLPARYGTLSNGDVLRTDAAFARHLVEDCAAAKYLIASESAMETKEPATKPKRRKKESK